MLHNILSNPQISAELQKLLTNVAELVGSLLGLVLMQAAIAVKNSHLNLVQKMVAERLVSYAEQTITGSNADKAAYVASQLKTKFPQLDEQDVAHLLEAAVLSTKAQIAAPQGAAQ